MPILIKTSVINPTVSEITQQIEQTRKETMQFKQMEREYQVEITKFENDKEVVRSCLCLFLTQVSHYATEVVI